MGKTTLVLRWAEATGRPFLYWVATRDTPAQLRADFCRALWTWAYPASRAAPRFESWKEVFEAAAPLLAEKSAVVLLGECKWGEEPVGRAVVRGLRDKAARVVPGEGWDVRYAFFARAGFSDAGRKEAESIGAETIDLEQLEAGLDAAGY